MLERIDKVLVSQNFGSRKSIHSMIKAGRVLVNNEVVQNKEFKVNPESDEIKVDDIVLDYKKYVYIMLNKPAGVVSASRDPKDRTVVELVPDKLKRRDLFPAGRLDKDTEGLLIITNDGEFAHRVLAPKERIYKTYMAVIDSEVDEKIIEEFENGLKLSDGYVCLPAYLKILESDLNSLVEIKICEGKFHQIKNMFKSLGMNVLYLKRTKIGNLTLDKSLDYGMCRELAEEDIAKIFEV